jgi:hypothetical protein
MDVRVLHHATRGPNVAALMRVEVPGACAELGPTFVCYFRVSYADGTRVEEWTRCCPSQEDAFELYQRGVEDFIEPVPFALARVEAERPPQRPGLFQVVHSDGARSVPMALSAAEREADFINGGKR